VTDVGEGLSDAPLPKQCIFTDNVLIKDHTMYISFDTAGIYEAFPHKLTRAGWDYFVDLSEAHTELEIWRAFCTELYAPAMGPVPESFDFEFVTDMMTHFFGDHAGEEFDIGIYPASRLEDLGCEASVRLMDMLYIAHRHGAVRKMLSRTPSVSADELDKAVNNSSMHMDLII
jgi:hypothetical protein